MNPTFLSFCPLSGFNSGNVLLHKSKSFLMSRSGTWHYYCLVRHGFLNAPQLSASFSRILKASPASDTGWLRILNSMIIHLSLSTKTFGFLNFSDQQLRTEGHCYGDISLKLWKDFLRVQKMWKLNLSMQMDTCQHPKLLTKKIPHKNSQRAAKYADVEGHCMHKVDNNIGSFIWSFL